MSFTRTHYDTCAYVERLDENVSVLDYNLDATKYEHCSPCRHQLGIVGGNGVSKINGDLVDLENNLIGIDRPTTKCAKYRYIPNPEYVQGKQQYKTSCYPKIGLSDLRHLPACQMFDYHDVPNEPEFVQHKCG